MASPLALSLSLVAALGYVGAALSLKRASEEGAELWHTSFVCNVLAGVLFQFLWLLGGNGALNWALWWQPALLGALFFAGQVLALAALHKGDVSVATPVLGLKIVCVAAFATVFAAQHLGWALWAAAILSTLGIAALNHSGAHPEGSKATVSIVCAAGAALAYALCDVGLQEWGRAWGAGHFLPLMMGTMGLLSLPMARLFVLSPLRLPAVAQRWLGVGSAIFVAQSMLFSFVVARFGAATASNVVYSSRGLWSIVAISMLGHWLALPEKSLGVSILRWRLAGAALMFVAILLVLMPSA